MSTFFNVLRGFLQQSTRKQVDARHLFELHGMLRCQSRPSFIDNTCRGKLNLAGRHPTPLIATLNHPVGNKRAKTVFVPRPFDVFLSPPSPDEQLTEFALYLYRVTRSLLPITLAIRCMAERYTDWRRRSVPCVHFASKLFRIAISVVSALGNRLLFNYRLLERT